MTRDHSPLARCVGDEDRFRTTIWGRRPEHRRSAGAFDDLLDVDDIEALLARFGRRPGFRLVRDGDTLAVESYTSTERLGGRVVEQVADVDRILDLVHAGATVVLQGLHRTWAPLGEFCADLQAAISHPVQANAYLSPSQAAAFRRHTDGHAVFALQVAGRKRWSVDGLGDVVLEAGDVLFLPAGTPHEARSADTYSLHLTIGVLAVTVQDVVRRALSAGPTSRPLPLGFARDERRHEAIDAVSNAIVDAQKLLGDLDVATLADAEASRARRRRRQQPGGRLRATVDPAAVDGDAQLRRRIAAAVSEEDGSAVIEFDGRRLQLPAFAHPALATIAAGDTIFVDDLPGLDPESRVVLARRLVREGLLGSL